MLLMKYLRFFLLALVFVLPTSASAATFEVTGWIPYWRTATGTADVLPHLDSLTEINPFVYTLKQDGTIVDNGNLDAEPWRSLVAEAKKKGVRVIPTIMSSDREFLYRILSDQKSRIALEDDIAALVKEKGFDGIDIDFE
ncbi:MAG: glycosyl hydrolase family 18 protein, partial [Minisyncoccota bacterium]